MNNDELHSDGSELEEELSPQPAVAPSRQADSRCSHDRWYFSPDQVSAIAAAVTAIATIVYMIVSVFQLAEIHKQSDISLGQLRPWVKIDSIDLRPGYGPAKTLMFHWLPTGAIMNPQLQASVKLEKVGHSVAQNVAVEAWLFFTPFDANTLHQTFVTQQQQLCSRQRIHDDTSAISLFPSDSYDWANVPGAPPLGQDSAAAVIVCTFYTDASGSAYETEARAGLYENRKAVITNNIDADASILKLIRDPSADRAQ